jgi:hypothetical protein
MLGWRRNPRQPRCAGGPLCVLNNRNPTTRSIASWATVIGSILPYSFFGQRRLSQAGTAWLVPASTMAAARMAAARIGGVRTRGIRAVVMLMRVFTRGRGLRAAEHPDAGHVPRCVVGLRGVALRAASAGRVPTPAPLGRPQNQNDGDYHDRKHNHEPDERAHTHLEL